MSAAYARFWADDFDMDLPRILPDLDLVLGDTADVRLWTYGGTTHGRLNHPSVWYGYGGPVAFFGSTPDCIGKPDSYVTGHGVVECTWREAIRDAWPHGYIVLVDGRGCWDAHRWQAQLLDLMYDLRGHRVLASGRADEIRADLAVSLTVASRRLADLVAHR